VSEVRWSLRRTPRSETLARMVTADNPNARVSLSDDWVVVESSNPLEVTKDQVALAWAGSAPHELDVIWATIFRSLHGSVKREGDVAVVVPWTPEADKRGWHILVDAQVHDRWAEAAKLMGLTKKSFTTICVEYFMRTVLNQDREKAELVAAELGDR
jgi:hypothetical protein